jgi:hypothetical protein
MKGCELYGRYVFFDTSKNARLERKKTREARQGGALNDDLDLGE